MIKFFAPATALLIASPAHALSLVSLHGAPTPTVDSMTGTSVGAMLATASMLVLSGIIAYRLVRHNKRNQNK